MKTRVIHSRIDIETLVSVIDFYRSRKGVEIDPLSTKVSLTLNSIMFHLRESGQIPTHTPDEVEDIFSKYLAKPALGGPLDLGGLGSELQASPRELQPAPLMDEVEPTLEPREPESSGLTLAIQGAQTGTEDPRDTLKALIDESLTQVTQPSPELDPDIWAPDPNDLPDPGDFELNIEAQEKLAVNELPPTHSRVLEALARAEGLERSIMLMSARIILNLDPTMEPDVYDGLATQLRPHIEAYLKSLAVRTEKTA